jgi:enoyl-CoA hydratase/carnithine racemase
MNFDNILFNREDRAVWITLNRPEKLNAFGGSMREELFTALDVAGNDEHVRAIVITGAGRGFCAGGDIEFMAELQKRDDAEAFRSLLESGRRVVSRIRSIEKPVIAMVNGVAAGAGLNLALACDIRIASETARFSQAFTKIGLHPDWGGTFFLPRLVGTANACELIFTGDMIGAQDGLNMGLLNRVVPADQLLSVTREMVEKLVCRPPRAIALAKRAIYKGIEENLEAALDYEMEAQTACFNSEDASEGIQAFIQRREPKFTGK